MTVLLPADEYLARPLIVAWLAYPTHERFRARSIEAAQNWARWRCGLPVEQRKRDLDRALVRMGLETDRQLLAGEIFRRQVLMAEFNDGFFGDVGTRSFAERAGADQKSAFRGKAQSNLIRDLWAKRRPSLALAAGACEGLAVRPSIKHLLFGKRQWALPAIRAAERWRHLACQVEHAAAPDLLRFCVGSDDAAHI